MKHMTATRVGAGVNPDDTNSDFRIGSGVGVVGRWFRLFIGLYYVVFMVLRPILLEPMSSADLLPFVARVGLNLVLIAAIYFAVFWAIGELVLSRMNPWTGTLVFLGTPTLLFVLGVLPPAVGVALGLYISLSLIATFFMRYGGCEVVALPSLLLRRRYTMYCPYNALDAVERAVSLDVADHRERVATVLSLAIVVLIGGSFALIEVEQVLGRYGIAFDLDNRWAFLLLFPILHLSRIGWKVYRSGPTTSKTGNYVLGAIVLLLLMLVFLLDGLSDQLVWNSIMILGGVLVVAEFGRKTVARQRQHGDTPATG